MTARVVLLNGVGSVGKTSIAKALRTLTRVPFLHVSMDTFFEMMPERYFDHPDGLLFEDGTRDGKPAVAIKTGPVARRLYRGMQRAIAALATEENDLIVDDVLLDGADAAYSTMLAPFKFYRVGIFAPLEIIESRERARGDRRIGLARWQFDRVHQGVKYDLEIDAGTAAPLDCAQLIRDAFDL